MIRKFVVDEYMAIEARVLRVQCAVRGAVDADIVAPAALFGLALALGAAAALSRTSSMSLSRAIDRATEWVLT